MAAACEKKYNMRLYIPYKEDILFMEAQLTAKILQRIRKYEYKKNRGSVGG